MTGERGQTRPFDSIQRHRVSINAAVPIGGVSIINQEQAGVFDALKLKKPTEDAQLTLL